jgi:hypothetical protein
MQRRLSDALRLPEIVNNHFASEVGAHFLLFDLN